MLQYSAHKNLVLCTSKSDSRDVQYEYIEKDATFCSLCVEFQQVYYRLVASLTCLLVSYLSEARSCHISQLAPPPPPPTPFVSNMPPRYCTHLLNTASCGNHMCRGPVLMLLKKLPGFIEKTRRKEKDCERHCLATNFEFC